MTVLAPTATRADITCRLGDSFTLTFPVLDDADVGVTLTGWSVRAQVRHTADDTLLYEWTSAPTAGQGTATIGTTSVSLIFDGVVTEDWAWRRDAQYDLRLYEPDGTPHVVAAGRFRVIPPITQAA